jgi:hypothetical protein
MKTVSSVFLLTLLGSANAFVSQRSVSNRFASKTGISSTELFERKTFIAGNWKLNPQTRAEAVDLARGIVASISDYAPSDVSLFVPAPFIEAVQAVVGDKIIVGAEVSSASETTCNGRVMLDFGLPSALDPCCVPADLY